ncbi:ROK family protein [Zooshikella marina]|uniref:ROK family protein n=1 Tax=Zooshikella ganghwensis TaxID=202772 RepID=UPI001BB06884|nr:ROK family protein [Zooshikella ganghwensis]MBU2704813.1 ROK family protein [Zooshikella ganghwensis]
MAPFIKGNIDLVRQLNTATIYRTINYDGPISRTRLVEVTSLAAASVTKITRQLINAGLVQEVSQEESTGGRRPTLLATNKERFYIISTKLGRGFLEVTLNRLNKEVVDHRKLTLKYQNPEAVLQETCEVIHDILRSNSQVNQQRILGIGLAMPGLIDPTKGVVIENPHYQFKHFPIVEFFEREFNITTFVDNDIRSLALAENYFGASQGIKDSVLISVRHGIGAGIMINGQLFYGCNQNAGEVGHIFIEEFGPKCNCGNYGCLETVASNPSIIRQAKELLAHGHPSQLTSLPSYQLNGPEVTIKDICQAALNGDELCQAVIKRVGNYLGLAIATVINLFNPQMIIIAGDIVKAQHFLFPSIKKQMEDKALQSFACKTRILASQVDTNETIGAFSLVQRALLEGKLFTRLGLNSM